VHCTKISPPEFEFGVKRQRSKSPGTKNEKLLSVESSPLTILSQACATAPYAAGSSRLYNCVAAGGDRVTPVHADGGLRGSGPPGLCVRQFYACGKISACCLVMFIYA